MSLGLCSLVLPARGLHIRIFSLPLWRPCFPVSGDFGARKSPGLPVALLSPEWGTRGSPLPGLLFLL